MFDMDFSNLNYQTINVNFFQMKTYEKNGKIMFGMENEFVRFSKGRMQI